jgi:hypothetical protein
MPQVHASHNGRNAPYVRRDGERSASEESDAWQRYEEKMLLDARLERARKNGDSV